MEEELRCFHCGCFYHVPILLGCNHALCLSCAISLQKPEPINGSCSEGGVFASATDDPPEYSEADKVSVLSDADSGVSCCSQAVSLGSAPEGGGGCPSSLSSDNGSQVITPTGFLIKCPQCGNNSTLDEAGANGLPRFRVLAAVVDKYLERFQVTEPCQLCDDSANKDCSGPQPAELFCDQCLIFYCASCRETCHPSRGPFAEHWLVTVAEGRALLRARRREREGKCAHHPNESVSMYCVACRLPVCVLCLHNGRHHTHDVHALNVITKTHKTELSQNLQQLSEKARAATDFIHTLKQITEDVEGNCREVEGALVAQIDGLVEALHDRRTHLINWVRCQRDGKVRILREQAQEYTQTLQSTTGTIHFCIEALKEADPAAFMEAQGVLEDRIDTLTTSFTQAVSPEPRVEPSLDLSLDDKTLLSAINQLTFVQLKRHTQSNGKQSLNKIKTAPETPTFVTNDCSAENNSVTVSWVPHKHSATVGYLLEIDDGDNGPFKEVYSGAEMMCTIDGLHFNSLYRARVRAFNDTGISSYSEMLCLQTAEVAWFNLEYTHPDLVITNDGNTVHCDSFEHRLSLGSVGFSRGTHYWEFVLDKYDGNGDIAFGVAKRKVQVDKILGRCDNSWGMYIDSERSWLMHGGEHFRRVKGGVRTHDTIGVLLSCTQRTLSFYVNRVPQGSMALTGVNCVLYPAVSLNRSVTLTVQTGLQLPDDCANEQK